MNSQKTSLADITLAPYIDKAQALIDKDRHIGGNMFRHQGATLFTLLNYGHIDPVLLKASLIHDLFEDVPTTDPAEIAAMDKDGPEVVELVMEVTKRANEPKAEFLQRIQQSGSSGAKLLKTADRISNIIEMSLDTHSRVKMTEVFDQTIEFVVPMAAEVDQDMAEELKALIKRKRRILRTEI